MPKLSPAQKSAFESLRSTRGRTPIAVLAGRDGTGRTTIARAIAEDVGAAYLDAGDLLRAAGTGHPFQVEERWGELISTMLAARGALVVDDFDAFDFKGGCGSYPRTGFMEVVHRALWDQASRTGGWVALVGGGGETVSERGTSVSIPRFKLDDYSHLFQGMFRSGACASVDYAKVFKFAPHLTARQISRAATALARDQVTTDEVIEYLRSQDLVTNVDLDQVEAVDLRDLQGIDDVIEKLEANIVLPLENDELAKQFDLTPRRGVLLYGPPGTGKTTVGRALAHRLKSKFFLIDGTCISGSNNFYNGVIRIFELAKRNAPAIVFVDDSDVIFETGQETGFYRYLLTILDGIESEEAGRLTVVLTAMDVAHLPPALIRSGRVELWLELRLPDGRARRGILEQRLAKALPSGPPKLELERLVDATEGFTGADLRRLVEDGKNLWAYAVSRGIEGSADEHFARAAQEIARQKDVLADAATRAQAHFKSGMPPGFSFPFPFSLPGSDD
jgi:ATP-dependent 26S proteasome regulatory subunit